MISSTDPNPYEQSFIGLMQTSEGKNLAHQCYIDWDITNACKRFEASEEWQTLRKYIVKYISLGSKVLDLGAGNGIGSYALAKMSYAVIAVEPNPGELVGLGAIVKMSRETSLNIRCISALGEVLPFESGSFSLVYCRQVLHHAKNLDAMLAEIARVLKKDGLLVATREHVIDSPESLEYFLNHHPLEKHAVEEFAYGLDRYISAIRMSEMKILKILTPWASVINYYPSTRDHRIKQLTDLFVQKFGSAGRYVRYIPFIDWIYRRYLESKDHTPGRMYSFIAKK